MILPVRMIFMGIWLLSLISGCSFEDLPQCPPEVAGEHESPNLMELFRSEGALITAHIKLKEMEKIVSTENNEAPPKEKFISTITEVYDVISRKGYINVKPEDKTFTSNEIFYDLETKKIQLNKCEKEDLDRAKVLKIIFDDKLEKIPITSLFESSPGPIGILESVNRKIFLAKVQANGGEKKEWAFCDEKKEEFKITFDPDELMKFKDPEKDPGKKGEPKKGENVNKETPSGDANKLSLKITGLKTGEDMILQFYELKGQQKSILDCEQDDSKHSPGKPETKGNGNSDNPGDLGPSGSSTDQSKPPNSNEGAKKSETPENKQPTESKNNPSPEKQPEKPDVSSTPDDLKKNEESSKGKTDKKEEPKSPPSDEKSIGKKFPRFGQFSLKKTGPNKQSNFRYKMEMRANYQKSTSDGRKQFSQASISYADDVFVLQTNSNPKSDDTRLVNDVNFNLLYSIDLKSHECSLDYVPLLPSLTSNNPNLPGYRWPQFEDSFNLLNLDLWAPNDKRIEYLETKEVDGKKCDVFERTINNFYVGPRSYLKAKATYYFTENDENNPPHKIEIEPIDSGLPFYASKIQLNVLYYTEKPEDDYDRFDISVCYKNPGSYRWVQFTVDSIPEETAMDFKKMESIFRDALHDSLSIPRIRIGQVRVNYWAPKVHIATQLIEHPDFRYSYKIMAGKRLKEKTKEYTLESIKDCADMCINSNKGCRFSYCNDKKCYVQILPDPKPDQEPKKIDPDKDLQNEKLCQTFESLQLKTDARPAEKHRLSTEALITNIVEKKEKINFVIGDKKYTDAGMSINAINGPDDLLAPYLKNPFVVLSDEYEVVKKGYKIEGPVLKSMRSTSYRRCLDACNDRDNCNSVSHCSDHICILSSAQDIGDNSITDKNCLISKKLYINRFAKISNQKLKRPPAKTFEKSVSKEECAKICSVDEGDKCGSFDYCETYDDNGKETERSCFIHHDHVINMKPDSESPMYDEDKSSTCGHYSKKVSRDFVQNFGTKFDAKFDTKKNLKFFQNIQSQDSCAFECLDRDECVAFQFCRKLDKDNELPEPTCKTSGKETDKKELLKPEVLTDDKDCSTFLHKNLFKVEKKNESLKNSSFNFAFFFSILAILTVIGSAVLYYMNRRRIKCFPL